MLSPSKTFEEDPTEGAPDKAEEGDQLVQAPSNPFIEDLEVRRRSEEPPSYNRQKTGVFFNEKWPSMSP